MLQGSRAAAHASPSLEDGTGKGKLGKIEELTVLDEKAFDLRLEGAGEKHGTWLDRRRAWSGSSSRATTARVRAPRRPRRRAQSQHRLSGSLGALLAILEAAPLDIGGRGDVAASAPWPNGRPRAPPKSAMWPISVESMPLPPAMRAASSISSATPAASSGCKNRFRKRCRPRCGANAPSSPWRARPPPRNRLGLEQAAQLRVVLPLAPLRLGIAEHDELHVEGHGLQVRNLVGDGAFGLAGGSKRISSVSKARAAPPPTRPCRAMHRRRDQQIAAIGAMQRARLDAHDRPPPSAAVPSSTRPNRLA